jgi:hypothetical protein
MSQADRRRFQVCAEEWIRLPAGTRFTKCHPFEKCFNRVLTGGEYCGIILPLFGKRFISTYEPELPDIATDRPDRVIPPSAQRRFGQIPKTPHTGT